MIRIFNWKIGISFNLIFSIDSEKKCENLSSTHGVGVDAGAAAADGHRFVDD